MIRTLIVDDEKPGREHLRARLEDQEDIEIVGEAADGELAVEAIQSMMPDLVFLDIQMPGLNGFEVLQRIAEKHLPVVVFVTAYDAYAIDAFEANAVDYLLKPFTLTRFSEALRRAREHLELREVWEQHRRLIGLIEQTTGVALDADAIENSHKPGRYRERIAVRDGERYFLVPVNDIIWAESARNYVELHCESRSFLIRSTLTSLDEELDPRRFARVHRSALVNLDRIREIRQGWHGELEIVLETEQVVRLSRKYRERVLPK